MVLTEFAGDDGWLAESLAGVENFCEESILNLVLR
jgi:hypothetical protein